MICYADAKNLAWLGYAGLAAPDKDPRYFTVYGTNIKIQHKERQQDVRSSREGCDEREINVVDNSLRLLTDAPFESWGLQEIFLFLLKLMLIYLLHNHRYQEASPPCVSAPARHISCRRAT